MSENHYMKMADAFHGDIDQDDIVILDCGLDTLTHAPEEYAAHAINSHDELVAENERLRTALECATNHFPDVGKMVAHEGWKLVPVEPTADQFGGMARDIIQWLRFTESKDQHSESLVKWLKDMGNEIPGWLYSEPEVNHLSKHVISKGSIAAIIYKAMLSAAPTHEGGES